MSVLFVKTLLLICERSIKINSLEWFEVYIYHTSIIAYWFFSKPKVMWIKFKGKEAMWSTLETQPVSGHYLHYDEHLFPNNEITLNLSYLK